MATEAIPLEERDPESRVTGTVRTNKTGSSCEFDICTVAEWLAMTEEEQNTALTQAMHDSGMMEYFPNV